MERLIELVREEPVIYDVNLVGHSDQNLISNSWENVEGLTGESL